MVRLVVTGWLATLLRPLAARFSTGDTVRWPDSEERLKADQVGKFTLELLDHGETSIAAPTETQRSSLELAVTLKAFHDRQGRTSFFFSPTSEANGSAIFELADALSSIDDAPILFVDMHSGQVKEIGLTTDSPQRAFGLVSEVKQIASANLLERYEDRSVSKDVDATRGSAALPARLLSVIEEAKQLFGYVLVDGPCVLTEPTGVLAASKCDGTILTVAAGRTKMSDIVKARKRLELGGSTVLGFVMEEPHS